MGPRVHSRVKTGMALLNWSLFSDVRTPVLLPGTLRDSARSLAGQSGHLSMSGGRRRLPFQVPQGYCDSYQFSRGLASSPFEALNSEFLASCQKEVRPALKMRRRPRVCSRVSTGHSDIPSPYEKKYKPAFKSLQGNTALF